MDLPKADCFRLYFLSKYQQKLKNLSVNVIHLREVWLEEIIEVEIGIAIEIESNVNTNR